MTRTAIAQDWEESERGWGVRPDGTTIHRTREDRDAFVAEFYRVNNPPGPVPDEYTRTCGEPYEVVITDAAWRRLADTNGGWARRGDIEGPT